MSSRKVQINDVLVEEDGVIDMGDKVGIVVHKIVGEDGLTDKERNNAIQHLYPVFTMVEIKLDDEDRVENGLRLYVHSHTRDFDGTPLYNLTADIEAIKSPCTQEPLRTLTCPYERYFATMDIGKIVSGYSESCMVEYRSAESIKNKLVKSGYLDEDYNWIN